MFKKIQDTPQLALEGSSLSPDKSNETNFPTSFGASSATARSWFGPACIVGGVALGFATGLGAARFLPNDTGASPAAAQVVNTAPSEAALLAQFQRTDWNAKPLHGVQGHEDLVAGIGQSELLRTEVLNRYRLETQPIAKDNVYQLLTAQPLPSVAAVGIAWAQQQDNAAVRADGFNLLIGQPPSAEIYSLARQAVEQEKDPKALANALWVLRHPEEVPDPAEVQYLVPLLRAFTQHSDENILAASIQQLAHWDKNKLHVEQDVIRIVNANVSRDTHLAAVGASSISSLNSDDLKQAFVRLIAKPDADPDLLGVVLMQMDRFSLTASEYEAYQKARAKLLGNNAL